MFGEGQKKRHFLNNTQAAANGIGARRTADSMNNDTEKELARESDGEIANDEEVILTASAEAVLSKRFAGTITKMLSHLSIN